MTSKSWEILRSSENPIPTSLKVFFETVEGTGTSANDPLSLVKPLGILESLYVLLGGRANHVSQQSQEVQEDQDSLAIDLRHASRKKPSCRLHPTR